MPLWGALASLRAGLPAQPDPTDSPAPSGRGDCSAPVISLLFLLAPGAARESLGWRETLFREQPEEEEEEEPHETGARHQEDDHISGANPDRVFDRTGPRGGRR
jgi:hypothetical protein